MLETNAAVVALVCALFFQGEPAQTTRAVDTLCGPRCVKFILEYMGNEVPSLHSLIREIQGGDPMQPANIKSLQDALRKRGLNWSAVKCDREGLMHLDVPVIVHTPEGNGHFLVLLRTRGEVVELWDGASGTSVEKSDVFRERLTGYALIPSDVLDSYQCNSARTFLGIPTCLLALLLCAASIWLANRWSVR